MEEGNIVKTEIKLSDESVEKVITAKVAEVLMDQEDLVATFVSQILHYREAKKYSQDPPNPTFFEKIIQASVKPILEKELQSQFEKKYRKQIQKIIASELARVLTTEDSILMEKFVQGVEEAFSKFHYYIRS